MKTLAPNFTHLQVPNTSYKVTDKKVFIKLKTRVCETSDELLASDLCQELVRRSVTELAERNSILLGIFGDAQPLQSVPALIQTLQYLAKMPAELVGKV